jgi:type I restriction enzyme, S subunit
MKYRLGDICTITKGATGIMKAIPGDYTMIALGEADKTHIEYQFDAKAVIIPLVSSTGHGHASMKRVKYFEGKFALGNILCAVIPNDESFVLAKYLHIYLHWNREELLVSQMKGMANVSLPINRIADVMVTIPSMEKQKEIIRLEHILAEKEVGVNKLFKDQLEQIEKLNQAILQQAVQGKLVAQDPDDEPASDLLKRIRSKKESLIQLKKLKQGKSSGQSISYVNETKLPINWIWCKADDIFFVTKLAGFEYTEHVKLKENGEVPVVRAQNVRPLKINKTNLLYIDSNTSHLLNRCALTKKCLLLTFIGAGIGDVATFDEQERWHLAPNVAKLETFENCEELIDIKYVNYFFISALGQRELFKHIKATAQPSLSMGTIRDIDIPIPPIAEQKRIAAEIERQFFKTQELKDQIVANQKATEQLLKALLHQAFEAQENIEELKEHLDLDLQIAFIVAQVKNQLGINYGEVALQKTVFNSAAINPVVTKPYSFINSNFGTYSYELRDDLKANPYLTKHKIKGREVYIVKPEYSDQLNQEIAKDSNKPFLDGLKNVLKLYELPFINKETDKIELLNTVLKVSLDTRSTDVETIYKGMKEWRIDQKNAFKTKADKFSFENTEIMLRLLIKNGVI